MKRLSPTAGIAIGPILFVLALLGILASVISSGSGGSSLGTAANMDRVAADIVSQANLIRSKILECQMQYLVNGRTYASAPCANDAYPCSDQTNGTLVSALTCPNDPLVSGNEQSLWTGLRVSMLPPPTKGFNDWRYMNAGESGGRCIWTTPTGGKTTTATAGLTRAATKFTAQEVSYDSANNSPKFVVFITRPTGTVDSLCAQE
jgi:hypothetical protein